MGNHLVISATRVLVGSGGQVLSPGAVLIDEDTIIAVGSPASVTEIAGLEAQRLDYPGATILPGLIDSHVHLAFGAGHDTVAALSDCKDAELFDDMASRARELLDTGITTVRDLGDRNYLAVALRERISGGKIIGPRILTAGAPLTTPGGHCWFLGGEVESPEQIRDLVGRHAAAGVDCIKVMVSGGHLTAGTAAWQSQFTVSQLRVIVTEAARVGLPVAAHAHATASIVDAVEAGVDTVEHCSWISGGTGRRTAEPRDEVLEMIADKGIAICPTIPAGWLEIEQAIVPGYIASKANALRCYHRHGIRMIAGTDAGVSPRSPFDGYVRHLELFAIAGIPLPQILDIATSEAATALGVHTGALGHGYSADLIVVDGDPRSDLDALHRIELVIARGLTHIPARRHHSVNAAAGTPSLRES